MLNKIKSKFNAKGINKRNNNLEQKKSYHYHKRFKIIFL
jgi:hypothetical protein